MQLPTIPKVGRLSKKHKITAAGIAAAAAVALTVTGLEATAGGSAAAAGDPTGFSVSTGDHVKPVPARSGLASQKAVTDQAAKDKAAKAAKPAPSAKAGRTAKPAPSTKSTESAKSTTYTAAKAAKAAKDAKSAKGSADARKAADEAAAKKAAAAQAKKKATEQAAVKKAAANRSAKRVEIKPVPAAEPTAAPAPKAAPVVYPNNLDGWIRHAQAELAANKIPVPTYNGIYRNIIRESSGNPNAINLWDINARNGVPSKGLLQVIAPTFQTYHVPGTSWNIYDPVANISAACNYAWHRYGGMDNVYSAY